MTNPPPNTPHQIILASTSPRRQLILNLLRIPHTIHNPNVNERAIQANTPREYALKAALLKATAPNPNINPQTPTLTIAADTIVILDNQIIHKPTDPQNAHQILTRLSGRDHKVITAIALHETNHATQLHALTSTVTIRPLTPTEIHDYVATGEPLDKAGAYGIQGIGGTLVQNITGDYFNVVGLPINTLLDMLTHHTDTTPWRTTAQTLTPQKFATHL